MPFSVCVCVCVYVCLQMSPFYKDTSHITLGATLLQDNLILTNYICNDSTYK